MEMTATKDMTATTDMTATKDRAVSSGELDWRTASEDELLGPRAVALREGQPSWLVAVAFLAYCVPIAGWLVFMRWPSSLRLAVAGAATAVAVGCFLTLWWSSQRIGRAASAHLTQRLGATIKVTMVSTSMDGLRASIEMQLEHLHSRR